MRVRYKIEFPTSNVIQDIHSYETDGRLSTLAIARDLINQATKHYDLDVNDWTYFASSINAIHLVNVNDTSLRISFVLDKTVGITLKDTEEFCKSVIILFNASYKVVGNGSGFYLQPINFPHVNDIFITLGLDADDFVKDIVGYKPDIGTFPEVKTIPDLIKVTVALKGLERVVHEAAKNYKTTTITNKVKDLLR